MIKRGLQNRMFNIVMSTKTTSRIRQKGKVLRYEQRWDTFQKFSSHLSGCSQFSTMDSYHFCDFFFFLKCVFLKGRIWPQMLPAFLAFVLPPLSPLPHEPVLSPDFNRRHFAVPSVSLKKAWNPSWSGTRQKPGHRSSPLLPVSGPPPPRAAFWSIVLISGDAKQTQRRNYKH